MEISLKFFGRYRLLVGCQLVALTFPMPVETSRDHLPQVVEPHHGHDMAMGGATMVIPVGWQVQDRHILMNDVSVVPC